MSDELKPASPLPWKWAGCTAHPDAPIDSSLNCVRLRTANGAPVDDGTAANRAYIVHAANNHARLQARVAELEAEKETHHWYRERVEQAIAARDARVAELEAALRVAQALLRKVARRCEPPEQRQIDNMLGIDRTKEAKDA
jgi:ribosome-binding protein aMBF1 (putative translation factor)